MGTLSASTASVDSEVQLSEGLVIWLMENNTSPALIPSFALSPWETAIPRTTLSIRFHYFIRSLI